MTIHSFSYIFIHENTLRTKRIGMICYGKYAMQCSKSPENQLYADGHLSMHSLS